VRQSELLDQANGEGERVPKRSLSRAVPLAMALMGLGSPAATPLSPPSLLSQTGLYAAGGLVHASGVEPYSPRYPLWSDGAAKARWVYLPEGQKIDTSNPDAWAFPVGTKFWKQFSFHGRKVETRLIWKATKATWVFATYAWQPDQRDAVLAPETGLPNQVEIVPGKRHTIPSLADCNTCHTNGPVEILGFSALQLATDRDPLTPHAEPLLQGMVTLKTLAASKRLQPDVEDSQVPIRASTPLARAVLGYLSANCGICHKQEGPLKGTVPQLKQLLVADPAHPRTILDTKTRKAILRHMSNRGGDQMPPLATVLVDEAAVALVRRWSRSGKP